MSEKVEPQEEKSHDKLVEKFIQTLQNNSRNRQFLHKLSEISSDLAEFQLSAEIWKFEKANFSSPEEQIENEELKKAHDMHNVMRMFKLNIDPAICFLFMKAYEVFKVKGGDFSIKDQCDIEVEKEKLYGKD